MNDSILVELYDSDCIALVVEHECGIHYEQQCGGIACDHPIVEGYLIPIKYTDDWDDYVQKTCDMGCFGHDLIGFKEDFPINFPGLELDESRLSKGTEAFVPVKYYGKSAWLMFPNNCD